MSDHCPECKRTYLLPGPLAFGEERPHPKCPGLTCPACTEKDAEIARLTSTFPCGHNRVVNDNGYGDCLRCQQYTAYEEDQAEIERLKQIILCLSAKVTKADSAELRAAINAAYGEELV